MGRHSAPDDHDEDDLDEDRSAVAVVSDPQRPGGRHSGDNAPTTTIPTVRIAQDEDRALPEETTARIPPVAAGHPSPTVHPSPSVHPSPTVHPTPPAAPAADGSRPAPRPAGHATGADLALVRHHGDVRARCAAAVLVPFVVYVVVLVVIGELTVHNLVWIWAPAVLAGVLVGLVLDAGHKRYVDPAREPQAPA